MGEPVRIQLSRRKGFDLQAVSIATNGLPAVNVARPTQWGNPFKVGDPKWHTLTGQRVGSLSADDAVERFRRLECTPVRSGEIARLRGHNLACWCASGAPCHADVLLELANAGAGRSALEGEGRE